MNYTINVNEKFGSKEIYFDSKPAEEVREALKTLKFRWHKVKKCWYGFANENEINAALNNEPIAIEFEKVEEGTLEKMKLYLNGCYFGECLGYHQQRDENGNKWIFEIENKEPFKIHFEMIKSFTSSGELRIITKARPAEEAGDPIPKEEKSK